MVSQVQKCNKWVVLAHVQVVARQREGITTVCQLSSHYVEGFCGQIGRQSFHVL